MRRNHGLHRTHRNALAALAGGDLTVRLGSDGLSGDAAAMAEAIDSLADQMTTIVQGSRQIAEQIDTRWREVLTIGDTMSATAETTATRAIELGATSVQVSNNMQVLAAATEELSSTVREIASYAASAAQGARVGIDQASTTSETMTELETSCGKVDALAELISSVSSQTRLLSLNARIEAANAGSAGRGFTVIASEVGDLAAETSGHGQSVSATVIEIAQRSHEATVAMASIRATIGSVSQSQDAIAAAVEQQTGATSEIGRLAGATAQGSAQITALIKEISIENRRMAYGGSLGRNAAAVIGELHQELVALTSGLTVATAKAIEQVPANVHTAEAVDGVIRVRHHVLGDGLHQFAYSGDWAHSAANDLYGTSAAFCSMPDDTATLRFEGVGVRFHGSADAHHGMAAISIDGGEEVLVDLYSEQRKDDAMLWASPTLVRGSHVLTIRVPDEKNPLSRYYWTTLNRVDVLP